MSRLQEKLDTLPTTPGVYIYKDAKGGVLYVGKAKVLRSRVRSYFATPLNPPLSGGQLQPARDLDGAKTEMVRKITDIETISVDTETEALILEANLIRKYQPPYNVVLRDDKYYLFIKITTREEFPRVFPVRNIKNDGARYFGPYSSARSVRHTLKLLRRIFPYREEKETPREIIFPHALFTQTNKPPVSPLSGGKEASPDKGGQEGVSDAYKVNIENIIRFLRGDRQGIIDVLRGGMKQASRDGRYEQAAIFRDQLQAIERLEGNQKVFLPRNESFDVVSIARATARSAANVFQIRGGKLLGKQTFLLSHRTSASLEDTLRQFLLQYYRVAQDIPALVCIPITLPDQETIGSFIAHQTPVAFAVPHRGKKRQLLAMGETNAQLLLDEQDALFQTDANRKKAISELAHALGLAQSVSLHRIETYDVSNIQGKLATASMVVFIDGASTPSLYRKFRLSLEGEPNDFAMLQEALHRRFANHQADWPMPDLVLVDGGKGQLSAAKKILESLSIPVPVVSIAKREEELFVPGNAASVRLPHNSPALQLVQRMRDEAHRFTITYHRLLRSKKQSRSILDEVPGIGPKTKKKLIGHFGSLKAIRAASDEELGKIVGKGKVSVIRDFL